MLINKIAQQEITARKQAEIASNKQTNASDKQPSAPGLTKAQSKYMALIRGAFVQNHCTPTAAQLAELAGVTQNAAFEAIRRLVKMGKLEKVPGCDRYKITNIEIVIMEKQDLAA